MIGLALIISTVLLLFVSRGLKIVKEWDRVAVLRLGKYRCIRGPGIIWMMPMLDKGIMVSLKEQQTLVDTGKYVSSDGSTRRLMGYVNWKIIDVQKAVLDVEDYRASIYNTIQHQIKKIGESFPGDTVIMDEESLYSEINQELEPIFTNWGVKITEIDLKIAPIENDGW